jgi:hypothetical protein
MALHGKNATPISIINPKGFLFAFLSTWFYNEAVDSQRTGPVRRTGNLGPGIGRVGRKWEMGRWKA